MYAAIFRSPFWRDIAQAHLLRYFKSLRSFPSDARLLLLLLNQTLILLDLYIALHLLLSSKRSNSYLLNFRHMSEGKHGRHVNIGFIAHVVFAEGFPRNGPADLYFADAAFFLGSWLVAGHLVESDEYFRWFGFHLRNEYFREVCYQFPLRAV